MLVRANRVVRSTSGPATQVADTLGLDLVALATAFAKRLQEAGDIAVTPAQSEQYARALQLDPPGRAARSTT
ncbi:MAG: hypothetical protein QOJ89_1968 [bacterium]